jgi:hypothetical protein
MFNESYDLVMKRMFIEIEPEQTFGSYQATWFIGMDKAMWFFKKDTKHSWMQ